MKCDSCPLGKANKLHFFSTHVKPFELIYGDLWTFPILSINGAKYYFLLVDDCTH